MSSGRVVRSVPRGAFADGGAPHGDNNSFVH